MPTIRENHSNFGDILIKTVYSLSSALVNESKLDMKIFKMSSMCGFSGESFRHFMNNMGSIEGLKYLEVGTYCGSTLLSLLYDNLETIDFAYAIDNWSDFNDAGLYSRDTFYYNLNYIFPTEIKKLKVIEEDCFSLDKSQIKHKINFYFYDGPHSEEDHYNAYIYYDDLLENQFITVIDDWNSGKVKSGTKRAFKDLGYEIVASWEIDTKDRPDWSENPDVHWWRGVYICVINKTKTRD